MADEVCWIDAAPAATCFSSVEIVKLPVFFGRAVTSNALTLVQNLTGSPVTRRASMITLLRCRRLLDRNLVAIEVEHEQADGR